MMLLLEMRLDNIVFRLGMASTIPGARQLVNNEAANVTKKKNSFNFIHKKNQIFRYLGEKSVNLTRVW
jgi:ribosomal protein S4